jgi:hypothetical protein
VMRTRRSWVVDNRLDDGFFALEVAVKRTPGCRRSYPCGLSNLAKRGTRSGHNRSAASCGPATALAPVRGRLWLIHVQLLMFRSYRLDRADRLGRRV